MGGIRDPDWLDLPPISSLGMGVHSLINLPANSTIKKKAAIIIMAVEVIYLLKLLGILLIQWLFNPTLNLVVDQLEKIEWFSFLCIQF